MFYSIVLKVFRIFAAVKRETELDKVQYSIGF